MAKLKAPIPLPTPLRDIVDAPRPAYTDDVEDDPRLVRVTIGTKRYVIRPVPFPRLKRFKDVWTHLFGQFATLASADWSDPDTFDAVFGLFEDGPVELLKVAIPNLDVADAMDEDEGFTVPQLLDALESVLKVNRIEGLKNLIPFLQKALQQDAIRRKAQAAQAAFDTATEAMTRMETAQTAATPSATLTEPTS